jgi:hypothetical protein
VKWQEREWTMREMYNEGIMSVVVEMGLMLLWKISAIKGTVSVVLFYENL